MIIFLLGNGFDLHHGLPTNYINFLNTVDFILNEFTYESFSTIDMVFGNPALTRTDETIKKCYEKYGHIYKSIDVDAVSIHQLITLARKNEWFRYMLECYRKNATWIDFEQEISYVCGVFEKYFEDCRKHRNVNIRNDAQEVFKYFISMFQSRTLSNTYSGYYETINIKQQFLIHNEDNRSKLNEPLIVETLFSSLNDLAKMLSLYLRIFVDNTIESLVENDLIKRNAIFNDVDHVFTLNYTNTFVKVYGTDYNDTLHIHGNIDSEIVLGVQADKNDELQANDTTFIPFKKYYQRSIYDTEYLMNKKIYELKQSKDSINLFIMGHSLDVTDRDIIKKLFDVADRIVIYYYGDKKAQGNYIKKLIHIFGQEKYDEIATRTLLQYLPLPNAV